MKWLMRRLPDIPRRYIFKRAQENSSLFAKRWPGQGQKSLISFADERLRR